MAQVLSQVQEDDRRIRSHTRRAQDELGSALIIVRRAVRGNPRARSLELELARVLHGLDNLGTLVSKFQVEEAPTKGLSSVERARAERALRQQSKVKDLVDGQDLVEEND